MPELAEVEYYRRQWNCGLGEPIVRIALHPEKRLFRTVDVALLGRCLPGSTLAKSEANGKQLLFRFTKDLWLGLHLGMTGKLTVEAAGFNPGKHDHLVLFQAERALVFHDPRVFGRVHFAHQKAAPAWWAELPIPVNSPGFQRRVMEAFLLRHGKLSIKAALLLQAGFPGIGNWMADEILWRAKINPLAPAGNVAGRSSAALWKNLRFVCQSALRHVGRDLSDPPRGWLFHERWSQEGQCPIHRTTLTRETVGGRTTAWCPRCQAE